MSFYSVLKFVHVALAIVAIGINVSYALWLRLAAREPEHSAQILRGIKSLDDRLASPAYALLLVTGFILVFVGDVALTSFWILSALGLYVGVVVGGFLFYTPTLRGQIALAEAGNSDSDEYRGLAKRGTWVGGGLILVVFTIEFLMVTKPTL
jgi:uncharacterized membrane protein